MTQSEIELRTPDGAMTAYEVLPASGPSRAAVLFLMDGLGYRPALCAMADRLAAGGYHVLLPDLYYRLGKGVRFEPAWLTIPEKVGEIRKTIGTLTPDMVMSDVGLCLDHLEARGATRIGAVGYCMGGRNAFVAATRFGERLRATASIHPGGIVTPDPSASPHLAAASASARMYFAIAKEDMFFTREQADTLEAQLKALGKRYQLEHYEARHGFAIGDTPVYDPAEAERHWKAIFRLFGEALGPDAGA